MPQASKKTVQSEIDTYQTDKVDQVSLAASQVASSTHDFPYRAPAHFLSQVDLQNPEDPLLKQVVPSKLEDVTTLGFNIDPVGDLHKNPIPGFIHKYQGRALLIASPKCDIHCRYCFRRHFPYQEHSNRRYWDKAITHIENDRSLNEIILSGGDPMSLTEKSALPLIHKIEQIAHIDTLRIHSRVPVVSPNSAWNQAFLEWAEQTRLQIVLVVHCNHANELSEETEQLFQQYRQHNIHLLNQSVLLKGVNDSVAALKQLSKALFKQAVMPYYLHQLDKVQGAAHFEVDDKTAQQLHLELRKNLPGYLVPKLVREIAGEPFKSPIT